MALTDALVIISTAEDADPSTTEAPPGYSGIGLPDAEPMAVQSKVLECCQTL